MKLDDQGRERMFKNARNIHSSLGNIFQNSHEITHEMIRQEEVVLSQFIEEIRLYKINLASIERAVLKGQ